jgi:hypothetical protein
MGACNVGLLAAVFIGNLAFLFNALSGLVAGSLMVKQQMKMHGRDARLFGLVYLVTVMIGVGAIWLAYSGVIQGSVPGFVFLMAVAADLVLIVGVAVGVHLIGPKYVSSTDLGG